MDREKTISLLTSLLSGRVDVGEFKHQLSDILFELRQNATPNEDKRQLSQIQLYIHEFDEGNRDIHEVYIAAQAALDLFEPVKQTVPLNSAKIFMPPSEPGTVFTTTESPEPESSELLTPVPI
jgi:hypothetical protein